MICKKWFLAWMNWRCYSVIVIRKAPSGTPYQSLYRCHGKKRPKHHYVGHHSWQVAWWWLLLIKFDCEQKLYLGYHSTLIIFFSIKHSLLWLTERFTFFSPILIFGKVGHEHSTVWYKKTQIIASSSCLQLPYPCTMYDPSSDTQR